MPTTTASPARSSRMPASLARAEQQVVGPLERSAAGSASIGPTASWTASPATSASVGGGGSPERRRTTVEPMKLPAPSNHVAALPPAPRGLAVGDQPVAFAHTLAAAQRGEQVGVGRAGFGDESRSSRR